MQHGGLFFLLLKIFTASYNFIALKIIIGNLRSIKFSHSKNQRSCKKEKKTTGTSHFVVPLGLIFHQLLTLTSITIKSPVQTQKTLTSFRTRNPKGSPHEITTHYSYDFTVRISPTLDNETFRARPCLPACSFFSSLSPLVFTPGWTTAREPFFAGASRIHVTVKISSLGEK